jgi:translation initiation factor 2 beta subunit (eIF-2beta)/eIF-5
MFIQLKQKVECSKCGSTNHESFMDARYQGLRCRDCGHEQKDLHPYLKAQSGGSVYASASSDVIKF